MQINKFSIAVATALLCAICVAPSFALSPWFSASYREAKETLRRYSYCSKFLDPINLKSSDANETEYLIKTFKRFLDVADFRAAQAANLSLLLEQICSEHNKDFQVAESVPTPVFYESKSVRCRAIDDAFDKMYPILKAASFNKSEKLDFSNLMFGYQNKSELREYSLTDLVVTSWITSGASQDRVCHITSSLRQYLNQTIERRDSMASAELNATSNNHFAITNSMIYLIDTLLDDLVSMSRRAYWDGTTVSQQVMSVLMQLLNSSTNSIGSAMHSLRIRLPYIGNPQSFARTNNNNTEVLIKSSRSQHLNITSQAAHNVTHKANVPINNNNNNNSIAVNTTAGF